MRCQDNIRGPPDIAINMFHMCSLLSSSVIFHYTLISFPFCLLAVSQCANAPLEGSIWSPVVLWPKQDGAVCCVYYGVGGHGVNGVKHVSPITPPPCWKSKKCCAAIGRAHRVLIKIRTTAKSYTVAPSILTSAFTNPNWCTPIIHTHAVHPPTYCAATIPAVYTPMAPG